MPSRPPKKLRAKPEPSPADGPKYAGPHPVTLREFLAEKLPPAVPRIWPWLDSGESCLLWGGSGTGKSWVAMTLALGVAGGGEALGWEFRNPARVLYVDGEQSSRDLHARFRALGKALGKGHDAQRAAENLLLEARTRANLSAPFFDLSAPEHAEPFVEFLKSEGVEFVVFDNLSTLSDRLEDENAATAFKPMQALFAKLKAENIASVLVHHSGKAPGARFRGSSNIATTFERIVALRHNDRHPPTTLAAHAEVEKYRAKPPPGFSPRTSFALATAEDSKGQTTRAVWEVDHSESLLAEAWRMFSTGEFYTVAEFVAAFNSAHSQKKRAGHFRRDFRLKWEISHIATHAEIERAEQRLAERREERDRARAPTLRQF